MEGDEALSLRKKSFSGRSPASLLSFFLGSSEAFRLLYFLTNEKQLVLIMENRVKMRTQKYKRGNEK